MKLEQKTFSAVGVLSRREVEEVKEDPSLKKLLLGGKPTEFGGLEVKVGCLNIEGTALLRRLVIFLGNN